MVHVVAAVLALVLAVELTRRPINKRNLLKAILLTATWPYRAITSTFFMTVGGFVLLLQAVRRATRRPYQKRMVMVIDQVVVIPNISVIAVRGVPNTGLILGPAYIVDADDQRLTPVELVGLEAVSETPDGLVGILVKGAKAEDIPVGSVLKSLGTITHKPKEDRRMRDAV